MSKSLLAATGTAALSAANGNYAAMAGGNLVQQTTEAQRQVITRVAGTISALAFMSESTTGTSTAVRSRVNGSNGNQVITPPNGAASAVWEDTTNSDSLSAGDKFNISIAESGTPNPQIYWARMVFEASSGHAALYACVNPSNVSSASTTVFTTLSGNGNLTTTEADKKCKARSAGTLTGGYVYVSANARVNDTTFRTRINGSNGNVVITVGAGLTGLFQDTSNTDPIGAGDDVNWAITTGAGTETLTPQLIGTTIVCSSAQNDLFASTGAVSRTASGTASFTNFTGASGNNTNEVRFKVRHGFVGTASRLRLYVSANTYTGDATVTFRKNGSDGNQTITIGAGLTGLFEDTSNTDDFDEDDDCCIKIVGGTANSLTYQWVGITEAPVAGVTEEGAASWSGVGTMTASLSQTLSGAATWAGAGSWAADGIRGQLGAATWAGAGAWAAAGALTGRGTAAWSGAGSWAATAVYTARAAGSWAGAGSWSAAGLRTQYGAAAWAGAGSWTGVGKLTARAAVTWSGAGTMTATGGVVQLAAAVFAGVGTMTARGLRVFLAVGKSAGQTISTTGQSAGQTVSGWVGQSATQSGAWIGKDAS